MQSINKKAMELAKRLIVFRVNILKISQTELGDIFGIHQSTIWRYEKGRLEIPATIVKSLHEKHGMSLEWFYDGIGKPNAIDAKSNLIKDLATLQTNYDVLQLRVKSLEEKMFVIVRDLYAEKHGVKS